ncbi:MAG: FAD-binding oxidoreductase [Brucellaceae bacterium]|nr:FAD-binding oxidoreductase [Brucellaceae bacterium]
MHLDYPLWNWSASDTEKTPATYYEASLEPWQNSAALPEDRSCDVLVIGGGLLGLSAALHLAESGVDTLLVEKNHIGSAASGRNGGQLTPGLARWEAADMLSNLSCDEAKRLWRFASVEAMTLIDEFARGYDLQFDRRYGHITAAVHPGHLTALLQGADARFRLGDSSAEVAGRHKLLTLLNSDYYHGGVIDRGGGQLHPLALVRGLAYAFARNGGETFEETEVVALQEISGGVIAETAGGKITARKAVVLALHNSTFSLDPDASATTIPFYTYVGVTKPLDEGTIKTLLPADMPVYDTQVQIDYYRPVSGNRLLFGGQGTGSCWAPQDINAYLLQRMNTVFPQYSGFELDYSWSGVSDFTLNGATDSRKTEGCIPVYTVHGWSGHGVAQTVRIGKAISDDIRNINDDFAMLTTIDHYNIPMGRHLSPFAIPVAKAALEVMSTVNPGKLISF